MKLDLTRCIGGAWIKPDGEIVYVVREQSHKQTLEGLPDYEFEIAYHDYAPAFKAGFVRVATYNHWGWTRPAHGGLNFNKGYVTVKALETARSLLSDLLPLCDADDFYVEAFHSEGGYDIARKDHKRWLNAALTEVRSREAAALVPA